jgi:lipoprotein NlpD
VTTVLLLLNPLWGCANNPQKAPISDLSSPVNARAQHHRVSPGETLYSIALKYDIDYKKLSEINNLDSTYRIHPGQLLSLTWAPKTAPASRPKSAVNARSSSVKTTSTRAQEPPQNRPEVNVDNLSFGSIKWKWPIKGKVLEGFNQKSGLNKGIDIHAKLGEPVVAAADGEVVYSGSGLRGYGKLLIVKHNQNYLSAYAHNSVLNVVEGDAVKAGQKIAEAGLSGTNTPKLHFEIRVDGKPVDPLIHLPKW